jgi:hypothetical protein
MTLSRVFLSATSSFSFRPRVSPHTRLCVPEIRSCTLTRHDAGRSGKLHASYLVPFPRVDDTFGCSFGPLEGSRDHRLAPPADRARPARSQSFDHRSRSEPARRDRSSPSPTPKDGLAGDSRHAVALASPSSREALDPAAPSTRTTIHRRSGATTCDRDGDQQPDVGISPDPRRARRSRSSCRSVHDLENPQGPRHRSSTATASASASDAT